MTGDPLDGDRSASTMPAPQGPPVTVWGPPASKPRRPVGMGDVALGFVLFILLGSVPAVIGLIVLLPAVSDVMTGQQVSALLESSGPILVASLVLSWAGFLLPTWWAAVRKGDGNWRELLKWRFHWRRDLPIAVGFTIGFRLLEAGFGVLLGAFGVDTSELGNTGFLSSVDGIWLVLVLMGAAIGAPFVEEIFFRGLFLSVAVRNWGPVIAVVVTSLVFGLMHTQASLAATIYTVGNTAVIGALLAIMVLRTNRLGTSIAAHVLFNTSGVILAMLALASS